MERIMSLLKCGDIHFKRVQLADRGWDVRRAVLCIIIIYIHSYQNKTALLCHYICVHDSAEVC